MHTDRETKPLPRRTQPSSSFSILSTVRSVFNYFTDRTPLEPTSLSSVEERSRHSIKSTDHAIHNEQSSSKPKTDLKRLLYFPHGRWKHTQDLEVTETAILDTITRELLVP